MLASGPFASGLKAFHDSSIPVSSKCCGAVSDCHSKTVPLRGAMGLGKSEMTVRIDITQDGGVSRQRLRVHLVFPLWGAAE